MSDTATVTPIRANTGLRTIFELTVAFGVLKRLQLRLDKFVSHDEHRVVLCRALFKPVAGWWTVAASDSFRLIHFTTDLSAPEGAQPLGVPVQWLFGVMKLIDKRSHEIQITITADAAQGRTIRLRCGDQTFEMEYRDGEMPNYENMLITNSAGIDAAAFNPGYLAELAGILTREQSVKLIQMHASKPLAVQFGERLDGWPGQALLMPVRWDGDRAR